MDQLSRFGSASLSQMADLLGITEQEVVSDATRLVGEGSAHRGWLTPEAVSVLLERITPVRPLSEAEPIILQAFRQARESAKSDWNSMAVPVLKNRLLLATSQSFNEFDYGAPNIWHFVTLFPHLLRTDGVRPRERVHLLQVLEGLGDAGASPVKLDPMGKGRLRVDLWRAIFDYTAGQQFVWDEALGRARPSKDGDHGLPVLPTLTQEDVRNLRREFVGTQEKVTDHDSQRLEEWAIGTGATAALPKIYRSLWSTHLKSHAANTLRAFFAHENLDVPEDLFGGVARVREHESDVERRRRLAHHYVDAMTGDELARLSFEIGVIARVPLPSES